MQISQVQIAGAGAGKTYGLAELICKKQIKEENIYMLLLILIMRKRI